ncbi:MAG: 50S ribosomal protein L10 [candidate division WOR-3 bacterium]
MGLKENEILIKEISERLKRAKSLCFTSFLGMKADQINKLRRSLKRENAELKVFKNTLIKKAFAEKGDGNNIEKFINGPTALVFCYGDPIQPLKVLYNFKKDNEQLVINGGLIEGEFFNYEVFGKLISIPSKEELYRKIVSSLSAPINRFVFILRGVPRKVVSVLSLVAKQKEE